jgi:putative phosphoesterase
MIGIISDTHDNVENVLKAKEVFKQKGVSLVLHAGDIIAPKTVDFFDGLKVWFVKGNCDGDVEKIKMFAEKIGGKYLGELAEFELEEKKFCMYHGKDQEKLAELAKSQEYDYIITGHIHQVIDNKEGKTRVINPGAHYYIGTNTIATLDIEKDNLEFIELK